MKDEGFVAYSDESGTFQRRYQSIALISGQDTMLSELRKHLGSILDEHGLVEVKFNEVGSHSPKVKAASEFVQCAVKEFASQKKARIDVLTWDTQDSRHTIQGRDDIANLERMYYKILTHAARQWNQIDWNFYPDKNSQIHWDAVVKYLNRTSLDIPRPNLLTLFETEGTDRSFRFQSVEPLDSAGEPLIQLADLFAGMARFMREEGQECVQWLDSQRKREQPRLPQFECSDDEIDEPTKTRQNRFRLVGQLNELCKRLRLGVSLRGRKYLWTPNPCYPINFWNYEPQHEYDKAPIK